ncbi:ribosome maturation factor RimP [Thioalkalivibrio sp.]|uniref:ribosome maturation factor RimP n=1 Tax=Thioalkalivibrio sp. TaxID=2093813 RepID=UPI0035638670
MALEKSEELGAMLRPVVGSLGFDLWGLEYHAGSRPALLRLYIDHPDGITVDDCGNVSEQVSAVLDVEEPIRGDYVLEVSSPGIERPLFTAAQYRQYLGSEVKVRLAWPEHGRRNYRGRLLSVSGDGVEIEVDGDAFLLPFGAIARARLLEPAGSGR